MSNAILVAIEDRERLEAIVFGRRTPGDDAERAAAESALRDLGERPRPASPAPPLAPAPLPSPTPSAAAEPADVPRPALLRLDVPPWRGLAAAVGIALALTTGAALVVEPPRRGEESAAVFDRAQSAADRGYLDYGFNLERSEIDPLSFRLLFGDAEVEVYAYRAADRICIAFVTPEGNGSGACTPEDAFAVSGVQLVGYLDDPYVAHWGPTGPLDLTYRQVRLSP